MATPTRTRRKDATSPTEPAAAPVATETTPAEPTAALATEAAPADAGSPEPTAAPSPAAGKPTSARDRMKVTMVGEILADYPDGIPAAELVTLSELQPAVVARVLTAMEATSAAYRQVANDGTESWYRGTGELAAVDLASAPVDSTCPTCKRPGWTVKVGGSGTGPRRRTTGNGEPGVNGDGKPKLRKGELTGMVRDFLRSRPGEGFTDGELARELGERHARVVSSGAIRENLTKLLVDKQVSLANPDDPHDRRFTWAG